MATKKTKTAQKLKVFEATLGFFDTVVAVPSQAAALRAWGTSQNLFKDKTARLSEDAKAKAAALDKPGAVLRRPVGTTKAFGEAPGLPEIPDLPSEKRARSTTQKAPDRKALGRAEAALERVEERRREKRAEFEERRRKIDADEAKAEERFENARKKARDRVQREQRAFEEAGGKS